MSTWTQFVQRMGLCGVVMALAILPLLLRNSQPATVLLSGSDLCPDLAVNGSFETPVIQESTVLIAADMVEGWQTSAADGQIEIWTSGAVGVESIDGQQFVELNANGPSRLFQDVATPTAGDLTVSISHRGRDGTETIAIVAGPAEGPFEKLVEATAGPDSWETHSASYVVPSGQAVTRIGVESVQPLGSLGNLVDALVVRAPCHGPTGDLAAVADSYTSDDIGVISADVSENDIIPDGALVEYRVVTPPVAGVVQLLREGEFDYFGPRAGVTESFSYEVCLIDTGACATASVDVIASPFNEGPFPAPEDGFDIPADGSTYSMDVLANDTDDIDNGLDPATLRVVAQPLAGSAVVTGGMIDVTVPTDDRVGEVKFDYEICDIDGACATATVRLQLAPPEGMYGG